MARPTSGQILLVCILYFLFISIQAQEINVEVGPQHVSELTYFQFTGVQLFRADDVDFHIAPSEDDPPNAPMHYIFNHHGLYGDVLPQLTYLEPAWKGLCGVGESCSACYDPETMRFMGILYDNGKLRLRYTAFMQSFTDDIVRCPFFIAEHGAFPVPVPSSSTDDVQPRAVTVAEPYTLKTPVAVTRTYPQPAVFTFREDPSFVVHEPYWHHVQSRVRPVKMVITSSPAGTYYLHSNTSSPFDPFSLVHPAVRGFILDMEPFLYCSGTAVDRDDDDDSGSNRLARIIIDPGNDHAMYLHIPEPIQNSPAICHLFLHPLYSWPAQSVTLTFGDMSVQQPLTPLQHPPAIYAGLSNISSTSQVTLALPAHLFTGLSFVRYAFSGHYDSSQFTNNVTINCFLSDVLNIELDFTQQAIESGPFEVIVTISEPSQALLPFERDPTLVCQFQVDWDQIAMIPDRYRQFHGNNIDIDVSVHIPSSSSSSSSSSSMVDMTTDSSIVLPVVIDIADEQDKTHIFRPSFTMVEGEHTTTASTGFSAIYAIFELEPYQSILSSDSIAFVFDYEPFFFPIDGSSFRLAPPECTVYYQAKDGYDGFGKGLVLRDIHQTGLYESSIVTVTGIDVLPLDRLRIDCTYEYAFTNIIADMADLFINVGVLTENDKRFSRRLNPAGYNFRDGVIPLPTKDEPDNDDDSDPDGDIDDGMTDVLEIVVSSLMHPTVNLVFAHGNFSIAKQKEKTTNMDVLLSIVSALKSSVVQEDYDGDDAPPGPKGKHVFRDISLRNLGITQYKHYLHCIPVDSMMESVHPSEHCAYGVEVHLQIPYDYDNDNHYVQTYEFPDRIKVTHNEIYKQRAPRACLSYYRIGHEACSHLEALEAGSVCITNAACESKQCINGFCAHPKHVGRAVHHYFNAPPYVPMPDSAFSQSLITACMISFISMGIMVFL